MGWFSGSLGKEKWVPDNTSVILTLTLMTFEISGSECCLFNYFVPALS